MDPRDLALMGIIPSLGGAAITQSDTHDSCAPPDAWMLTRLAVVAIRESADCANRSEELSLPALRAYRESVIVSTVLVDTIIDTRASPDQPLGDAVETFLRRKDAERFIAVVNGDGAGAPPDTAESGEGAPGAAGANQ